MPRPKRFRRIFCKPAIRCFRPDLGDDIEERSIEITLDEFESIRLKDYHNVRQNKAAEIMGISQPTFNRILNSARKKLAEALVESKTIIIKGEDYITDKKRYKCKICGFEWYSPTKEYEECPDCGSEEIYTITAEEIQRPLEQPGSRGVYGVRGIGAGPPRACKCPQCGYETEKTRGVPCRTIKCPKCDIPLYGAD